MRAERPRAKLPPMKTWIALALAAVGLAAVPAAASAGTLTGKLPRKGKPMTVRVVRADTAAVAATKRLAKPRYKIAVKPGPYVVLGAAGKRDFASRLTRVRKRGTKAVAMRAAAPPIAIVAIDPDIEITGLPGRPNGVRIYDMLLTDMFNVDCSNGGDITFIETAARDAIERELALQRGKGFDPKTRVKPNFTKPDTFVSGRGEVSGGMLTVDLVMTGKVNGSSSVTVPVSQLLTVTETLGSDLVGQICNPAEDPAPPPVVQARSAYTGSLSGSAVITSPAGTTTETWSAGDVRFTRTRPSSDTAPNYEITAGTLQFSVTGTVGQCTFSGSEAMPLAVTAGEAESTLDLAPDDSYFAVGYLAATLDATYVCPGGDPFTMPYTAISEFLRTNPGFERRVPDATGGLTGSASATKDGKSLSWSWSLSPRG
jgi:hypothetical protein